MIFLGLLDDFFRLARHTSAFVLPPTLQQKKSIPGGFRKNHILCWDNEFEKLYQNFLQSLDDSQSSEATTTLLIRLDKKLSRTSTFHTLAIKHGALLAISLANHDTPSSLFYSSKHHRSTAPQKWETRGS